MRDGSPETQIRGGHQIRRKPIHRSFTVRVFRAAFAFLLLSISRMALYQAFLTFVKFLNKNGLQNIPYGVL